MKYPKLIIISCLTDLKTDLSWQNGVRDNTVSIKVKTLQEIKIKSSLKVEFAFHAICQICPADA